MRSMWIVFVIGLATGHLSEKLLVSGQTLLAPDDLYLESSGGFATDNEGDDEDFSGSGSGDFRDHLDNENVTMVRKFPPLTEEDTQDRTLESTSPPPTTQADVTSPSSIQEEIAGTDNCFELKTTQLMPTDFPFMSTDSQTTEDVVETTFGEDFILPGVRNEDLHNTGARDKLLVDASREITSESIWERTDVLSAVIACGVVGFLCALFLVLLIAYRMKKKDEGSYSLGVAKVPPSAYQKQPPKEFYA